MDERLSEYIIYAGAAFTVEWYIDPNGHSPSRAYYEALPVERRVPLLKLVRLMGEVGKIFDLRKFRNEGDKIFAFKPQPDRFLCFFFAGRKIIVTNAFEKKSDKLPKSEKERALRAKNDYEQRIRLGTYYG